MFRKTGNQIQVIEHFNYDARDVALAFQKIVERHYPRCLFYGIKNSWLTREPLNYLFIKTKNDFKEKILYGPIIMENNSFRAEIDICPEGNPTIIFLIIAEYQKEAEKFLEMIRNYLSKNSIYKGKALMVQSYALRNGMSRLEYDFMDLSSVSADQIIYGANVLESLKANLWTIIENPNACFKYHIKRQRKILLEGPYGAGKTLTALLTAQKAVTNGWTFICLSPTSFFDNGVVSSVFKLASQYQPAVIFIEDIDQEQGSSHNLRQTLAAFDGIFSKKDEIVVVMTTNLVNKIEGAMLRPGRIDKIIRLGVLSQADIQRIICSSIPEENLEKNINWEKVSESCLDYTPAFIKEMASHSLLWMISQSKEMISEDLLIKAALDLKEQFESGKNSLGFQK